MPNHFTHLHLHSEFSLLDGAIGLDKLISFGKQQNFKALAITDHGNVFGAVKFFEKCKKAGIKPILGMEAYFTEDVKQKNVEKKYYHLIIIVQNQVGYQNLCKLISFAYQQGFYFKPRIDYETLERYSEGLIVTSACLGGHIPHLLMQDRKDEALERIDWFVRVFGRDRFFLEVQPEDQTEQRILNQKLYEISVEKNIQLVATGDCHYITAEDHEAHEVMLCIQTQNKFSDPDRFTFGDCRVHMRTEQEMLELFKDHPEAVWNSGKIADSCQFEFETGRLFFPQFQIPQEHTPESFFKQLSQQGLDELITTGKIPDSLRSLYQDRLDLEVNLICSMGFVGYFLVVSDFIRWAKEHRIPVGPGRGSAAGSLVAWALKITNVDPIKYNLLFERFLNPERITMPDIDIDFCIEGREAVINYIREKYGHDKVCQIITFGTMMAKGVIKDVARVLGIPFEDANAITTLIPEQLKITLEEAREQEAQLQTLIESNPRIAKLFNLASRLEGLTRHASKHAAGIVISPEPVDHVLPIYIPPKSTELVTQYAMTELESIGFLKIDLLGLKNLTLVDRTLKAIERNHGLTIDIDRIPLDDQKTFALICKGQTSGVFQLESSGLKDVLRKLQPEKFEDIIAVNALYRPGPLGSGMVDDFIERRHGRQKISYLFSELEPVLQETYGVIVYQEQVMKIAAVIGGYSLGEADILRKAMGKKKVDVMIEQRTLFLQRAAVKGFDAQKSGELFDLMAYFAGYGFNKSHSTAYASIAYQTAYLKAHYPAEFMAALISLEVSDPDHMSFYLDEAKQLGLSILGPRINQSESNFSVVEGRVLFGLCGIKNVGGAALENIIVTRKEKPFTDLLDFCTRIDLRTVNKRVIESLICAGACDAFPGTRAQKFEELQQIMDRAAEIKKALLTGQMGLFATTTHSSEQQPHAFTERADWDIKQRLEKEKEVIGFYMSAHPLDSYKHLITSCLIQPFATIVTESTKKNNPQEPMVIACGLVTDKRTIYTKKGDKMAFVQLEDYQSKAEIILFPKTFAKMQHWLDQYHVFFVKGFLDQTTSQCKIKANEMVPAELLFEQWPTIEQVEIIFPGDFNEQLIANVEQLTQPGTTKLSILFEEQNRTLRLSVAKKIRMTQQYYDLLLHHKVKISIISL
jgi:DNA polymerase III subunit alpha